MLKIYIITPFPDIVRPILNESMLKKILNVQKLVREISTDG